MQWPLRLVEFCDENVIGEEFTENGRVFFTGNVIGQSIRR